MLCRTVSSSNVSCNRPIAYEFKNGASKVYSCDHIKCRRAAYHSLAKEDQPDVEINRVSPTKDELRDFIARLESSIETQTGILNKCKELLRNYPVGSASHM